MWALSSPTNQPHLNADKNQTLKTKGSTRKYILGHYNPLEEGWVIMRKDGKFIKLIACH